MKGESAILEISKQDSIDDTYLDSLIDFDSKIESGLEKRLKTEEDDIYDYLSSNSQVGGRYRLDLTFNSKRFDQKSANSYLEHVKNLVQGK